MKIVGISLFVIASASALGTWGGGSLAIVQLGNGISTPGTLATEVRIIELDRASGTPTGSSHDFSFVGATGIGIAGSTNTEGGMNVHGLEAVIGGYQTFAGSSTSGADRRVIKVNLVTGAITGQSDLPASSFTAVIRDSGPFGANDFALATNQGVQTGTFSSSVTASASGSDTNVRFVSPNHGLFAYSVSTGGNYRVKEIGSSNILLDVSSEVIIVGDHVISSDGLTLYLASDSTTVGGLWRFTRPDTASPFSVPGVRIYEPQLRHVSLFEAGGVHQVFTSYKSGLNSWAYGFLSANTAGPATAPDWTVAAPVNTTFLGMGVTSAAISGTIQLADWVGAVAGRQMQMTVTPVGSPTISFSGSTSVGPAGIYSLTIPPSLAVGSYDVYADSTLFLKKKVGAVSVSSSGATGVSFNLANGDVNDSGEVDAVDIDAVIAEFGSTASGINEDADGSGEVDAVDIDIVITNFGNVDE